MCAERAVARCLPCLGQGTIRVIITGRETGHETLRPCPLCRGLGTRIMVLRGAVEVFVADEIEVADLGRCKGAFHPGRRAAFGRVACPVCGGRFKPMAGLRVPNHISVRPSPPKPELG